MTFFDKILCDKDSLGSITKCLSGLDDVLLSIYELTALAKDPETKAKVLVPILAEDLTARLKARRKEQ